MLHFQNLESQALFAMQNKTIPGKVVKSVTFVAPHPGIFQRVSFATSDSTVTVINSGPSGSSFNMALT